MEKENQLPTGVTQVDIDAWKEKYGSDKVCIATLVPDVPEKAMDVIIRIPDRAVYNQYDKWAATEPGRARDILVNSCLLSHKEIVKSDDELYFSCCFAIMELLPLHKAIVKKL